MLVSLDPARWIVVDDGVMGGRSRGAVSLRRPSARRGTSAETLVFHGVLRTREGGFTSIRSRGLTESLEGRDEIVLRVRSDGRRYHCDLRESSRSQGFGVTWRSDFEPPADRWSEVALPLARFRPTRQGRPLNPRAVSASGGDPARPFWTSMRSLGFAIADGIDGDFALEIGAVQAR